MKEDELLRQAEERVCRRLAAWFDERWLWKSECPEAALILSGKWREDDVDVEALFVDDVNFQQAKIESWWCRPKNTTEGWSR